MPYGGCTSGDAAANVWFSFTATADVRVVIDTSASDYNTGLNLFAGEPSDAAWLSCSERAVRFTAAAGTTYFVEVAACCGSSAGGQLVLQALLAPPPPTVEVVVDPVGRFDVATGTATVTGTATCAFARPASGDRDDFVGTPATAMRGQPSRAAVVNAEASSSCDSWARADGITQ